MEYSVISVDREGKITTLVECMRWVQLHSLDSLLRKWLLQAFMARLSKTEARRCTHRTSFAPGCTQMHPMQNESRIAKR